MYSVSNSELIFLVLILAPFIWWKFYLFVFTVGVILLCINRKKTNDKFYYNLGKLLTIFVIIHSLCAIMLIFFYK